MDDATIIVGGGLAGLMCATTLAQAGSPVHVLQAGGELGGRAGSTEHDGYVLNLGAHALYPSAARRLASVGVRVPGGRPRPDHGRVLFGGQLLASPLGVGALLGAGPLSVADRVRMASILASVVAHRPDRLAGQSAADWLSAHDVSPLLRGLLAGLLRVSSYGGDLETLPADLGVGLLREALRSSLRYVDGGWQVIVAALAAAATTAGARIELHARVTDLLGDGVIAGVRLADGRELRASTAVLAGLPPARALGLLADIGCEPGGAGEDRRAIRAACLDVALRRLPRPDCPFVLGLDEPLYLSVHSQWSRIAPTGGAVVELLRYDDGTEPSGQSMRERLETLLEQSQPGWREEVVHARFSPRLVVTNHLPSVDGGLAARMAPDAAAGAGVLLAGDWIGARGWLVGASLESAADAATAVLARRRAIAVRGAPTAAGVA